MWTFRLDADWARSRVYEQHLAGAEGLLIAFQPALCSASKPLIEERSDSTRALRH